MTVSATSNQQPSVLLTGATGNVGGELANLLSQRGIRFRALVRDPQKAAASAALANAELIAGDFNDPASIKQALVGIERAFLLTNSSEQAEAQQLAFVTLAQQAGVRHLIKLSQWAATPDSPVRFLRYHAAVEEAIRATNLAYTFLRPNLFMQGLLGFREPIAQQGKFFAAIGDAKISAIDVRDIAAVAAATLTEPAHENKTYSLTGSEALSHSQLAAQLSAALHRPITFVDVPAEAMRGALLEAGFPQWQAEGLIEDYAHYARGEAAEVTSDVQQVTGKQPRSFADFAHDYAPVFGGVLA